MPETDSRLELLTTREAAQILKVSSNTVRREIAAGRLTAVRVGRAIRIRRAALEQFVTPPRTASELTERGSAAAGQRPLEGIRVLAPEQVIAGPYGSMFLAAFGADVIRIERPPNGDLYRNMPPYVENERGRTGPGLLANSLNKRSLALDLQREEAREIFRRLVAQVDVIWENNRPGVMDRLGLGYQAMREINPGIVYVSISGFGQRSASDSPYADWPAFDIVAQAMGGLLMRAGKIGDPPVYPGLTLGDHIPALMAIIGCLLALRWRDLTGEGQHVDIAMLDATAALLAGVLPQCSFDPELARRRTVTTTFPYGAFACADGYFVMAVVGDDLWRRFCQILDRLDLLADPTLQVGQDRVLRADYLTEIIEAWAADKTADEASAALVAAGIPAGPVRRVDQLLACPHLNARGMILEIDDPVAGPRPVLGVPIRLSGVPPPRTNPPPQFGQHADEILGRDLGMTPAEIQRLRESGVVCG